MPPEHKAARSNRAGRATSSRTPLSSRRFFMLNHLSPVPSLLLFRKRSRSAPLFLCKRTHNASLSLPTFCGLRLRRPGICVFITPISAVADSTKFAAIFSFCHVKKLWQSICLWQFSPNYCILYITIYILHFTAALMRSRPW